MLELVLVIILVGLALWAVNTYVPMAQPLKTLLNVVVTVCVVLYVLEAFGVFSLLHAAPVPKV